MHDPSCVVLFLSGPREFVSEPCERVSEPAELVSDSCRFASADGCQCPRPDSLQLYGFTVSSGRHTHDRFSSSGWVNVAGSVTVIV